MVTIEQLKAVFPDKSDEELQLAVQALGGGEPTAATPPFAPNPPAAPPKFDPVAGQADAEGRYAEMLSRIKDRRAKRDLATAVFAPQYKRDGKADAAEDAAARDSTLGAFERTSGAQTTARNISRQDTADTRAEEEHNWKVSDRAREEANRAAGDAKSAKERDPNSQLSIATREVIKRMGAPVDEGMSYADIMGSKFYDALKDQIDADIKVREFRERMEDRRDARDAATAGRAESQATRDANAQLQRDKFEREDEEKNRTRVASTRSANEAATKAINTVDRLLTHPGLEAAIGMPGWKDFATLGATAIMPGTNKKDFEALLDQLTGQSFLSTFSDLKQGGSSGLGGLSNAEGERIVNAAVALKTSQSEEQFKKNLEELKASLTAAQDRTGQTLAELGAGAPAAPAGGAPAPVQGRKVTLKDGRKVILNDKNEVVGTW